MHQYRQAKTIGYTIVIAAGLTIALLVLSPLLLLLPSALFNFNWDRLSAIGQSYTGVAAILSAAALVGVVYSITLQRRQGNASQGQAVREMQFRLLDMASQNAEIAVAISGDESLSSAGIAEFRASLARNQWIRYLEFAHAVSDLPDTEIRRVLTNEFFRSAANRDWWTRNDDGSWKERTPEFYALVRLSIESAEARAAETP